LRRCGWPQARGLRRGILGIFFCFGSGFRLRFGFGDSLNLLAHFFCHIGRNRARMGLLFRDAIPGQKVNDGFGLDLQLAGQLINSDLIRVGHALRSELRLLTFRLFRFNSGCFRRRF
jgi:hypothetical protein